MIKILMCGNHPSNKGGMTSVIHQINSFNWEKFNIDLEFLPTYKRGNMVITLVYFFYALILFCFKLMFTNIDIVHSHMSYKGSFTRNNIILNLCSFFRVKCIIHLHGSEFEKWYISIDDKKKEKVRLFLKKCDALIVLGDKWKKFILSIEPETNVAIIHNSVEIPQTIVKWNPECISYLFMGVLIKRKGVEDLLKAFKEYKSRRESINVKLIIAGSGPEEKSLKDYVAKNNLEQSVDFVGWVNPDNKNSLIERCQILVSPSYNEGLPMSILEGMSFGMPIISTNVGDVSSAVFNGVNGYLIKEGDISAMVERLLLIDNRECFENMSKKSREISETYFSNSIFFNNLNELYVGIENLKK